MSCIRPRAPFFDTASGLKLDSTFITAHTKLGSTPCRFEAEHSGRCAPTGRAPFPGWKRFCCAGLDTHRDNLSRPPQETAESDLREWLPILRRSPEIRPRPFYNTRHSYTSFLLSIGAKTAFVSSQTGDTIRTLEKYYAKYLPQADSGRGLVEETILKSETKVEPEPREKLAVNDDKTAQIGKPLISQGLRSGAGDRGRTDDLMLGKHTL